jgi:NAD(P)H-dependent flavin oxidoreductase YrpB (nitropropane dioxygenase family)
LAPSPSLQTELTRTLGCRYPIIQTAMGWVATAELVSASIDAGAFGFLAAAVMTPEECEAEIKRIRTATDQPFGVNLHSFQSGVDRIIDLCIDYGVAAISYGRAPSASMIDKVKARGIRCVPTIGAARHARKAVELGADVLVCQGGEGGGHTGETPTWLLLAQVLDMDPGVPVVACGGFKDGRGLAAALAFGADGIAMGTRFLLTAESPTPQATKGRYLEAEVNQIQVFRKLDGLPQRMIRNKRLQQLETASRPRMLATAIANGWRFKQHTESGFLDMLRSAWGMARGADLSLGQTLMAANAPMIIQKAMVEGRPDEGVLPSGQVAGLIDDLPRCRALVESIVAQAEARLAAPPSGEPGARHAV